MVICWWACSGPRRLAGYATCARPRHQPIKVKFLFTLQGLRSTSSFYSLSVVFVFVNMPAIHFRFLFRSRNLYFGLLDTQTCIEERCTVVSSLVITGDYDETGIGVCSEI